MENAEYQRRMLEDGEAERDDKRRREEEGKRNLKRRIHIQVWSRMDSKTEEEKEPGGPTGNYTESIYNHDN